MAVVGGRIDRNTHIVRRGPAPFSGLIYCPHNIEAAEAYATSVGAKVERPTVTSQKRGGFVKSRIDGIAKIFGCRPLAATKSGAIEIQTAIATWPTAGKKEERIVEDEECLIAPGRIEATFCNQAAGGCLVRWIKCIGHDAALTLLHPPLIIEYVAISRKVQHGLMLCCQYFPNGRLRISPYTTLLAAGKNVSEVAASTHVLLSSLVDTTTCVAGFDGRVEQPAALARVRDGTKLVLLAIDLRSQIINDDTTLSVLEAKAVFTAANVFNQHSATRMVTAQALQIRLIVLGCLVKPQLCMMNAANIEQCLRVQHLWVGGKLLKIGEGIGQIVELVLAQRPEQRCLRIEPQDSAVINHLQRHFIFALRVIGSHLLEPIGKLGRQLVAGPCPTDSPQ